MSTEKKDDGGPAFPDLQSLQLCKVGDLSPEQRQTIYVESTGMRLRDWFAGQALAARLTGAKYPGTPSDVARSAYAIADAMLEARRDE